MEEYKLYQRKGLSEMTPYFEKMSIAAVSISEADLKNGSPKIGDMIARNPKNHSDRWLVAEQYFKDNLEPAKIENGVKTLGNTCANGATKNVKDIIFWGNGDLFQLISKASSQNEGWMKSTKAMDVGVGVVVQVTTQQRNIDGSYSIAEAITFVPGVEILVQCSELKGEVTSRRIVPINKVMVQNKL